MKDPISEVVDLKTRGNAFELIYQYCQKNGSTAEGEELILWIKKILSIGDPLGIIINNEIIAFLLLYCNNYNSLEAYICNVYVREDFRGKRLSRILIEKAIQICNDRAFRTINLDVAQNNEPAVRVYTSCGFINSDNFIKDTVPFFRMTYHI